MEHEIAQEADKFFQYKYDHEKSPDLKTITNNTGHLIEELNWLDRILTARLEKLNNPEAAEFVFHQFHPPQIKNEDSPYSKLVKEFNLGPVERLLLITSLAPHLSPELFTFKLKKPDSFDIHYPQLGGYIDGTFHTFVPTLQTLLHLLAGSDQVNAMFYQVALMKKGSLISEQIINLVSVRTSETEVSLRQQVLEPAQEYLHYFISGKKPMPDFGRAFPASLISTSMEWDQLVLSPSGLSELQRIMRWAESGKKLAEFTNHKISSGFACLFYGPPGTGKTLAARLIGKTLKQDVFRIDLSMIVSKYIGETEKNLAYLFNRAEGKNWILFFDEADSLFGKRTSINDSKDKWANLEMSYLLQRMEEYEGITILATNLKNNLDQALNRRFQSVVYFGRPTFEQRKDQWLKLLPEGFVYDNIDLNKLAVHNLTGANIMNVLKASCLEAFHAGNNKITGEYLAAAILREFSKEGRTAL